MELKNKGKYLIPCQVLCISPCVFFTAHLFEGKINTNQKPAKIKSFLRMTQSNKDVPSCNIKHIWGFSFAFNKIFKYSIKSLLEKKKGTETLNHGVNFSQQKRCEIIWKSRISTAWRKSPSHYLPSKTHERWVRCPSLRPLGGSARLKETSSLLL